jgi:hypothetical protein
MTELFIEKSKLVQGDIYDYSKVDYKNANTKIIIQYIWFCERFLKYAINLLNQHLRFQFCYIFIYNTIIIIYNNIYNNQIKNNT